MDEKKSSHPEVTGQGIDQASGARRLNPPQHTTITWRNHFWHIILRREAIDDSRKKEIAYQAKDEAVKFTCKTINATSRPIASLFNNSRIKAVEDSKPNWFYNQIEKLAEATSLAAFGMKMPDDGHVFPATGVISATLTEMAAVIGDEETPIALYRMVKDRVEQSIQSQIQRPSLRGFS